jgi:hypothetical protein
LVFAAERQLLAGYTREELRALVSLLDRLVAPSS